MTEALFQFIWQHSLYTGTGLKTVAGEAISVIQAGKLNKDAGPDFLEGRIKIGTTLLVGNIELHLKTSDWYKHGHQSNAAYQNLILHVVFEHDTPSSPGDLPLLELTGQVPLYVLRHYEQLMHTPDKLPCAGQHEAVRSITKESWLSRLLAERWEQKLGEWNIMLEQSAEDWRNLLYWRTAANFGFKTNAAPFLMLAQSVPLNVLARHRDNPMQLEAILFGQAGMLDTNIHEEYARELQQEYQYLSQKYKLKPIPVHLWKFLRMRPANFPTVRIPQFAALIHKSEHLFSQIIEAHDAAKIEQLLDVTASHYWNDHFRFGETHEHPAPKSLGRDSILNIIINTIAPIQFLYASRQHTEELREQSLNLLESVPAEKNSILTVWKDHGWAAENAAQSQALIQLYNNYCTNKRCLECAVGLAIIRRPN